MNRRLFLQTSGSLVLAGSGSLLLPVEAVAITGEQDFWRRDRVLELRRADTGELRRIRFYAAGQGYLKDGWLAARWMLRDAKDGNAVTNVDTGLLNLLYGLQEWARTAGKTAPLLTINSAYRTPRRNASIEGAARHSQHVRGRAVDVTMRGVGLNQLAAMAAHFNAGGIGHYERFIHLDTGRVRNWRG